MGSTKKRRAARNARQPAVPSVARFFPAGGSGACGGASGKMAPRGERLEQTAGREEAADSPAAGDQSCADRFPEAVEMRCPTPDHESLTFAGARRDDSRHSNMAPADAAMPAVPVLSPPQPVTCRRPSAALKTGAASPAPAGDSYLAEMPGSPRLVAEGLLRLPVLGESGAGGDLRRHGGPSCQAQMDFPPLEAISDREDPASSLEGDPPAEYGTHNPEGTKPSSVPGRVTPERGLEFPSSNKASVGYHLTAHPRLTTTAQVHAPMEWAFDDTDPRPPSRPLPSPAKTPCGEDAGGRAGHLQAPEPTISLASPEERGGSAPAPFLNPRPLGLRVMP